MAVNSMSSMLMVLAVVVLWTASTATAASGVGTFYEKYIRKPAIIRSSHYIIHDTQKLEKPCKFKMRYSFYMYI